MSADSIPEFASREAEAAFWDTHDFADYWDQLQPVEVLFGDDLSSPIVVTLDTPTRRKVSKVARDRDTDPNALVLRWIMDGLETLETD